MAAPVLAVDSLHASTLTVSLITAAVWAPWLLIGLPAGAWVDRLRKRPILLTCDAISAVLVMSIPVAAWTGHLNAGLLLGVTFLLGTAAVFFQTAWISYLPVIFPRNTIITVNSFFQTSQSAAEVAGPTVASALAGVAGVVTGLVLDAGSFLASLWCVLRVSRPEPRPAPVGRRSTRHEIAEGIRTVVNDAYLRCLALHGAACNLAFAGYQSIVVTFLIRQVRLSPTTVELMVAVGGLGGIVGASVAPWLAKRIGTARTVIVGKVGGPLFALLIPLAAPGWGLVLFAVGSTVLVAGLVTGNSVAGSFRQTYCPPKLLGRVVTSMQFVNLGTIPIGAALAGVLGTVLGTRTALWIMVTGMALSGLILIRGPLNGPRDLPAPSPPAPRFRIPRQRRSSQKVPSPPRLSMVPSSVPEPRGRSILCQYGHTASRDTETNET